MRNAISKILLLLLAFSMFSIPAYADIVAQNGIEAILSTDQQQYDEFDVIAVTLEVKNTTDREMKDVELNIYTPTGYVLEDGSSNTVEYSNIPAGQSKFQEVRFRNQLSIGPDIPDTGDHSNIYLWSAVLLASLTSIVLLSVKNPQKSQRMMCLLLCAMLISSSFTGIVAFADEDELEHFSIPVSTSVQVNGESLTISGSVHYDMDIPYTRAEWIEALLAAREIEVQPTTDHPYSDVAGMPYEAMIQTAVSLGILFPNGEPFYPGAPATREFAAATAIRSLGYYLEGDIECADAALVSYKAEAYLAADIGMMPLIDNYFYPDRILSKGEANQIFDKIEAVVASENPTHTPTGIKYQDNTVVLSSTTQYTDNGSTLIFSKSDIPQNLEVGKIIVLGNNAYRVEQIRNRGNEVEISYTLPSITDFIESVDIRGEAKADFSRFVPAEGVTVLSMQTRDSVDLPTVEISLNKDFDLGDDWDFDINILLDIERVLYNFDFTVNWLNFLPGGVRFVDARNCYVKVDFTSEFGAGIDRGLLHDAEDEWKADPGSPLNKKFLLGKVPLVGTDGFGATVDVYAKVEAEGKIEVTFNLNGLVGVQVLDNHVRNVNQVEKGLSLNFAAEVTVGPQIDVVAKLFNDKLISFGLYAGGKAAGSGTWRIDAGMICIDGGFGTFGTLEALEGTKLKEWLDIRSALEFELWDYNILEGHWENLRFVEACTYNKGILRGTVAKADDRTSYIKNAKVVVYNSDNHTHELGNERTDKNGQYEMELVSGTHTLCVSADGYIPFETLIEVETEHELYVETLLMVEGEEGTDETGVFGGKITDAVTGDGISDVRLTIRRNWNVTTGDPLSEILTNSSGKYSSELPLGNYTVCMERNGYVSDHFNIAVTRQPDMQKNGSMLPIREEEDAGDILAVVLRWGAEPSDLDSHMWGPTSSGGYFHTYYSEKDYYEDGSVKAFLDLDDTSSYGPETTTVYDLNEGGTFSFYVHDFSNRSYNNSTEMSNSGAYVEVFRGTTKLATYHIPTGKSGTVWHVFNYNADTRTLTPVNIFSSQGEASYVGSPMNVMNRSGEVSPDKE